MAVDMFLSLAGIKGESKDKKHAGEIDILAWSWGVSNSGTFHAGGGGGAGKANFQDISITKYVDKASHALLDSCATGKHIDTAKLIVRKAGSSPLEYIIIELTEVLVTSVSTGGSGGEDRLTENISLNFAKIKFSYVPQKPDGSGDTPLPFTYDIAANSK
ncbi:Hcp family type VI secretion system effector [Paucibacter sp. B51]|uniref:Hcp family type VI secretion system effector n=1 Tax=Paucibacter sp. B51 TaxID=2993315 RepID=UPI0022EBD887|nr:type VI secretion system tube protein Hcp [Paucibacter sp. B51]